MASADVPTMRTIRAVPRDAIARARDAALDAKRERRAARRAPPSVRSSAGSSGGSGDSLHNSARDEGERHMMTMLAALGLKPDYFRMARMPELHAAIQRVLRLAVKSYRAALHLEDSARRLNKRVSFDKDEVHGVQIEARMHGEIFDNLTRGAKSVRAAYKQYMSRTGELLSEREHELRTLLAEAPPSMVDSPSISAIVQRQVELADEAKQVQVSLVWECEKLIVDVDKCRAKYLGDTR